MSKELNDILIRAYNRYKDEKNAPVPISLIRGYLFLEGIDPDHIRNDIFEKKNNKLEIKN